MIVHHIVMPWAFVCFNLTIIFRSVNKLEPEVVDGCGSNLTSDNMRQREKHSPRDTFSRRQPNAMPRASLSSWLMYYLTPHMWVCGHAVGTPRGEIVFIAAMRKSRFHTKESHTWFWSTANIIYRFYEISTCCLEYLGMVIIWFIIALQCIALKDTFFDDLAYWLNF